MLVPDLVKLISEQLEVFTSTTRLPVPTCHIMRSFVCREKLSRRRSGGIVLLVKNDFAHYVKVDNTNLSKLILSFSVSHDILNLDIDFGVGYIPPHGPKFASDDTYMELQREILKRCPSSDQIVLMGDFNSRVGEKDDFCLVDEHLRNEFGLLEDESDEIANRFAQRNILLK